MTTRISALMLLLFVAACGASASFSVDLIFPGQDAKDATERVRVVAVDPSDASTCEALTEGGALIGDAGYVVEQQLEFDLADASGVSPLQQVGPGRRLFYAEAYGVSGDIILRGCSEVEAGGGGPESVAITLAWVDICQPSNGGLEICDALDNDCDGDTDEGEASALCPQPSQAEAIACTVGLCEFACQGAWLNVNDDWSDGCECRPSRDGVEYCDGLDNDCDGQTDEAPDGEAACIACVTDADCDDPPWCITGTCDAGTCQTSFIPDDTACDDGDLCTENDVCSEGQCVGQMKDCGDEFDCTVDLCMPDGSCSNELSDDACFIDGVCVARGQVQEGNLCVLCNPDVASLGWSVQLAGNSCDDGLWCTGIDTCDAAGNCLHTDIPCKQICEDGCDEDEQDCISSAAGTPCPDEFECTLNEECDGMGNCLLIRDHGQCLDYHPFVAECQPDCAMDESGCIVPPPDISVNCPDASHPSDQPMVCSISLPGFSEYTPCVTCRVLGPEGGEGIAWEEDFADCPGLLEDGWNDWIVEMEPPACVATNCGQGPTIGELFPDIYMEIYHEVDLSRSLTNALLCYEGGATRMGPGSVEVALETLMDTEHSGAFETIIFSVFEDEECFMDCVDLMAYNPGVRGNPHVLVGFSINTSRTAFTLDHVWIEASQAEDYSDRVSLAALVPDGTGNAYDIELTNESGQALNGFLHCSFEGGGGFGFDSIQFSSP